MDSNKIMIELMKYCHSNISEIVVPNYYLGRYECDLLKISSSGYLTEYEIKVSKADFKKDAEKKHKVYNQSTGFKTKHDIIRNGERCNRFYFVVPENLIDPKSVPDGFGLIYAIPVKEKPEKLNFKIVKVSKLLKKDPCYKSDYKHIAQNLTLKLINAKRRKLKLK